mgnify:CR=1 FL=1
MAAFGRVPNDAGMFTFILSFPTSLATALFDYDGLRTYVASIANVPVDDRFAMIFDAFFGWFCGCVQYGGLAILCAKISNTYKKL